MAKIFYSVSKRKNNNRRCDTGFTLVELIIFTAVFAASALGFIAILLATMRIQLRQVAVSEVSQQTQFLFQTIERYVERSSLIELPQNVATTTLKLRMASSTIDPLYIYLQGTTVFLKQTEDGVPEPLTSNRVNISDLSFKKRSSPPGHSSVDVLFTVTYNTGNLQQRFSQVLDTAIARVAAATFDSSIVPATSNTLKLGGSLLSWQSINDVLYFSNSNVGIGTANPGQTLEVNGGVRLNPAGTKPACGSAQRGTFWVTPSPASVRDLVEVCVKDETDTYLWAPMY